MITSLIETFKIEWLTRLFYFGFSFNFYYFILTKDLKYLLISMTCSRACSPACSANQRNTAWLRFCPRRLWTLAAATSPPPFLRSRLWARSELCRTRNTAKRSWACSRRAWTWRPLSPTSFLWTASPRTLCTTYSGDLEFRTLNHSRVTSNDARSYKRMLLFKS